MTGAYLRVKRNNKWENIQVEHLTDEERKEVFSEASSEELIRWLNLTCKCLSEIETNLVQKL